MQVSVQAKIQAGSLAPFELDNDAAYIQWRRQKLADYPIISSDLLVNVNNPEVLSEEELKKIRGLVNKANMCIYSLEQPGSFNKQTMKQLAAQLGLQNLDTNICADEDSITSLQTRDSGRHVGYIPYSSKKLSWHTDGYYNLTEQMIRGMMLHCVNNAPTGGENQLLDPEILYIHLRDKNPDYIQVLMDESALTIPPNEEAGAERDAQTGPVFSLDKGTCSLHLRYTARTRSIQWADNPVLQLALQEITEFLNSDSPYIFRYKLEPGQGLVCNNVLHNRSAFKEGDTTETRRLIYRARFYDRIK